jgi:hypothetical protein
MTHLYLVHTDTDEQALQVLLKFHQRFFTKWLRKSTLLHKLTTLNKKVRNSGIREEPFYMQLSVFADFSCPGFRYFIKGVPSLVFPKYPAENTMKLSNV